MRLSGKSCPEDCAWHRRRLAVWSLALLLVLAGRSKAQNNGQFLSLEEAWQVAVRNNLTLRQQEITLQQLQHELEIQKAGSLPTAAATVGYGYTSGIARLEMPLALPGTPAIEAGTHHRYELAVGVEQPLFTGFRTQNLVETARQQVEAQAMQKEVVRQQLLLQVGQLYYQIQLNQLQQEVLVQSISRAGHHLEKVRNFYQAQQAAAFDTLEVANRRLELSGQLQALRHLQAILAAKLAYALNVSYIPAVPLLQAEKVDLEVEEGDGWQAAAVRHRPELKQLGFLQQAQDSRIGVLRSALFPQVYASAAYHLARPGVDVFRDRWMGYLTAGVNLRWQVWDWEQSRRQVDKARLEYQRLNLEIQQRRQEIQQQITQIGQQLQTVREQIQIQRQLVDQERERYRIGRENYEQGAATSLDLSMSENTLTTAELVLQQRYVEWLQLRVQLHFYTGTIGRQALGR